MRIQFVFALKKKELPVEYRRAFLSLLKKGFQESSPEVYRAFYETGAAMKPFTFAVYLGYPDFSEDRIELDCETISLNFSTTETETGIRFYNSIVKNRFFEFPLCGGNALRLLGVRLLQEKTIRDGSAVFKTLSPFLVRLHKRRQPGRKDEYLAWNDERFMEKLNEIVRVEARFISGRLGVEPPDDSYLRIVEFTPIRLKETPIKHYGKVLKGIAGMFQVKARPEVLRMLYQAGIGSRRSEGFGMLEVAVIPENVLEKGLSRPYKK